MPFLTLTYRGWAGVTCIEIRRIGRGRFFVFGLFEDGQVSANVNRKAAAETNAAGGGAPLPFLLLSSFGRSHEWFCSTRGKEQYLNVSDAQSPKECDGSAYHYDGMGV